MGVEREAARQRILDAGSALLAGGGPEAVSTRAVSAAAGVQAPTLYRLFGDKQGLLDAVADHDFERYLNDKRAGLTADTENDADPVAALRRGFDRHVEFGRAHPASYLLKYASRTGRRADDESLAVLRGLLERVAAAGRLRIPVGPATRLMSAAGVGVTLAMIRADEPDEELPARAREAVLSAVLTDAPPEDTGLASRALALAAALDGAPNPLTETETALLRDWLGRLAAG